MVDYSQFEASVKSGIYANMTAQDGAATVNGCYCLEVKELDGAQKILFEKIPCSCFFAMRVAITILPSSPILSIGERQISSLFKKR